MPYTINNAIYPNIPCQTNLKKYYRMMGYRYNHNPPDYESWTSADTPDLNNPSGEDIKDIMVIRTWEE